MVCTKMRMLDQMRITGVHQPFITNQVSDEAENTASSPVGSTGGQKRKFSKIRSEVEVTGSSSSRPRIGSEPGGVCGNQQHISDSERTFLTGNDVQRESTSLESCEPLNSCAAYGSSRLLPDRMAVIMSSLSNTAWISSIQHDFSLREIDEILPNRNDPGKLDAHSTLNHRFDEKSDSSLEPSSMIIERCVTTAYDDTVSTYVIGGAVDVTVEEIEIAKPPMISAEVSVSHADAKINEIVQATQSLDEPHRQLLLACRAHRATVLRMSSSVGTGVLAPKSLQQLCQSGCSLLIRIGCITVDSNIGPVEGQPLSQLSPHSQSSQLPANGIVGQVECSPDAIIKQTHALMALSLHCAPDEVIAAVSDMLLTKINAQSNQSVWQEEDRIQPVTVALFLSGILLLRVRILGAHASRLLLRAVEVSVKRAPAMTVGFLLPSMVGPRFGSHPGLCQQSSLYQHEMLQRVARQVLSEAQCDDLLYYLSVSSSHGISRPDDQLSPSMLATCCSVDALLCSALSDYSKAAITSTGRGSTNKRKQGQGQGDSSAKSSANRSSAMELSAVEQDACLSKWTNTAAASSASSSSSSASSSDFVSCGVDLGSVWCVQLGLKIPESPSAKLESDMLSIINTVLSKVSIERPATATATATSTVTLNTVKLTD
jgi:hypothetical protein